MEIRALRYFVEVVAGAEFHGRFQSLRSSSMPLIPRHGNTEAQLLAFSQLIVY
jgi:hypothetical protein